MIENHQAPLNTTLNAKYSNKDFTSKSILDKAQGNWPMILEFLGINTSFLKNKHGQCPVCGGRDRFRFDNKNLRGIFYCNHCGRGDGVKLLQNYHGWSFKKTLNEISRTLDGSLQNQLSQVYPRQEKDIASHLKQTFGENDQLRINSINFAKREKLLNYIWRQSKPISTDEPVDCYFKARVIELSQYPSALGFHSSLSYYDSEGLILGKIPALLAIARDSNCQAITLHRTYLGNGCKANVPAPKKLMSATKPQSLSGAAIRLFDPNDGKLALAEGIDTALAFYYATQTPVWSTITAGGMEIIALPSNIKAVIIAADNDQSGREQEAASKLAKQLLTEERAVKIVMPPTVGYDFADMLAEENQ